MITTVGMETIAWYRYEGTVDTEGIGIEMERLAAREMSQKILQIIPTTLSLVESKASDLFSLNEYC